MYFLTYVVRPEAGHARHGEIEGAFVSCWMDLDSLDTSKAAALDLLRADGWSVVTLKEAGPIERSEVKPEGLRHYDQALVDKTVLVVHMWKRRS